MLLGAGDGTFGTAVHCRTGGVPFDVATGDLDRDGALDVAVANTQTHDVSIRYGDGTFLRDANYAVGKNAWALAIGGLNGDGAPDLAVANRGSNDISILLARVRD